MEVMNNILETCIECLPSSFLICKHFLYFLYTLPFCFRDTEECEDSSYEAHTSVQPEGGGPTCNRAIRHLEHPFTVHTDGHGEVHEDLAGDEAEDEAGADVDGVGDGPHPRRQHLGHHDPDQRAVAAVTQEQEDHWG